MHGTTDTSPPHLHNLPHTSSSREIEIVRKHLSAAYISLLLKRKHLSAAFNTLSDLQRTLSPCAGTRRTDARALRRPRSLGLLACTIESDADKAAGAERRREEAMVAGEAAAGLRRGTRARRSTRDRTDAADEVFQRVVKGRR